MLGVVGILVWPEVMSRTKELADATARYIDTFQFDGQQHGIASATVRTFDDMGRGIEKSFEKSFFWTIIVAPYTQGLVYLAWFLAVFFYALYRFVWQVGWLFLTIVGPFGMAAASTGTPMGIKIAKGTYMSVLNLACWPIGISILFALLNLGIHDYAQDPTSIGGKQAMVALIVALMIPVTLAFVKVFLSGGGLDTNLASFASQMTVMATLGALQMAATALSAIPGIAGPVAAGLGHLAGSARQALGGMSTRAAAEGPSSSEEGVSEAGRVPRAVAPMPANAGSGLGASGRQSAQAGSGFREAGTAALGALGRTAWTGAASIANMAVAAADAGARESGHIRPMHYPMSRSSSPRPLRGTGTRPSNAAIPDTPASNGGGGGVVTVGEGTSERGSDADSTGSSNVETGRAIPPTERVAPPGYQSNRDAKGTPRSESGRQSPRRDRGFGVGTGEVSGRERGNASPGSANLTGSVRIASLDDLGLGGVFTESSVPEDAPSSPSRTSTRVSTFGGGAAASGSWEVAGRASLQPPGGAGNGSTGGGTAATIDSGARDVSGGSKARPTNQPRVTRGQGASGQHVAEPGSVSGTSISGRLHAPQHAGAPVSSVGRPSVSGSSDAVEVGGTHEVIEVVSGLSGSSSSIGAAPATVTSDGERTDSRTRDSSARAQTIDRVIANAEARSRAHGSRAEDPANEAASKRPPFRTP